MECDLIIRNGFVIDPYSNTQAVMDVAVGDGKLLAMGADAARYEAKYSVDAVGCIVTPGLIDSHVHCFDGGNESGMDADMICPSNGVTAVIDGGTAGVSNYEVFSRTIIQPSKVTIRAFLEPSPGGQTHIHYYPENMDPKYFDFKALMRMRERHPKEIVALKMRISKPIVGSLGLEPLRAAVAIAEKMSLPVVVHTTNPAGTVEEVLDILRPGDVYCHAFHGTGNTIVGDDGRLLPCVRKGRERGVVFDVANGVGHFSFAVARAALLEGFYPDTISTDMGRKSMNHSPVYSLCHVLSKYLCLGMPLYEVIRCCTSRPAEVYSLGGDLGRLRVGGRADISVFRVCRRPMEFVDTLGEKMQGDTALIPQLTVLDGLIVYRQVGF